MSSFNSCQVVPSSKLYSYFINSYATLGITITSYSDAVAFSSSYDGTIVNLLGIESILIDAPYAHSLVTLFSKYAISSIFWFPSSLSFIIDKLIA